MVPVSKINLTNNLFYKVLDKAISGGEKSSIELEGNVFEKNEIGLVSKDESILSSKK